jgi:hypothetical protein
MSTKVIHRFIRNANIDSNIHNRVANRFAPFTNTLVSLEDPATQRKLTLIGTTNSSTTLSHRTRVLLEKLNPDALYVQASPDWWNHAKHTNVTLTPSRPTPSSSSMKSVAISLNLSSSSKTTLGVSSSEPATSFGGMSSRAHSVLHDLISELPADFNLLTPGLETYYALKHA